MPIYVSLEEFARMIGIKGERVRWWAKKGWIPYLKMPPMKGSPRKHGYSRARMMVPWRQALRKIRRWDENPPGVDE